MHTPWLTLTYCVSLAITLAARGSWTVIAPAAGALIAAAVVDFINISKNR